MFFMWTLSGKMIEYLAIVVIMKLTYVTCETSFDNTPLNVTVAMGKTAVLPCRVTGESDPMMIIWMNPKKILISQRDVRYIDDPRMSIERPYVGDWNLQIRYVRYEDRGEYSCTINSDPVEIRKIRLNVQVPSYIADKLSTKNVQVEEGNDVRLVCNATGIPSPTITWFRKTSQNKESTKINHKGGILMIYNITRNLAGIYECMAYNNVPPAVKRRMSVKVLFKPEVVLRNSRLGQYRGKETILECRITSSPLDRYVWKRGQYALVTEDSWKYRQEVFQDDEYTVTLTLRILSVEERDFDTYTCEASNSVGEAQASMELYEYHYPVTKPPTMSINTVAPTTKIQVYTEKYRMKDSKKMENSKDMSKDSLINDEITNRENDLKLYNQPPEKPVYKPEKQITGHVGTGYVYAKGACGGQVKGQFSLVLLCFAVQICYWIYYLRNN